MVLQLQHNYKQQLRHTIGGQLHKRKHKLTLLCFLDKKINSREREYVPNLFAET